MPELTIRKRSNDYICFQTDDPRIWDCGNTPEEAIGKWILTHFNHNLNKEYENA